MVHGELPHGSRGPGQLPALRAPEVGWPGRTGRGIALREDHCFFDATKRHVSYDEAEADLHKAAEEKVAEQHKENVNVQAAATRKRAKKATDKTDKAAAVADDVNEADDAVAAAAGNIFAEDEDDGIIAAAAAGNFVAADGDTESDADT